jgi:hypothetical protein
MHKPFTELFDIMEARRRQAEAGEASPTFLSERTGQAGRHTSGCPDAETLCGWVDGYLRQKSLRRWLAVWQHVHIWRCRACQQEIETLTHMLGPSSEVWSHDPFRPAGYSLTSGPRLASLRLRPPLAWASCGLVVVAVLSLWSFGNRQPLESGGRPLEPVLIEEMHHPSGVYHDTSPSRIAEQPEDTTIWGD